MSTLKYLPCPPWCRIDHGNQFERREEVGLAKRHHSAILGQLGPAYVDLGREDDLAAGQAGPVGLCVGSDGHLLTAAAADRHGQMVSLGGDMLSGQLSLDDARRRAERIAAAADTLTSPLGAPPAAMPAA